MGGASCRCLLIRLSNTDCDTFAHDARAALAALLMKGMRNMAKKATKKPGAAKKVERRSRRQTYTKDDIKALKAHSKARTPVAKIAKQMKRTEASLRHKAHTLGLGLGHRR